MTKIYTLPKNSREMLTNYTKPNVMFEGNDYIEFLGQPFDKYSLSKFKATKDPHFGHSDQSSSATIQTNTRMFSNEFNWMQGFTFRNPFPPNQTLLKNTVEFEDGTEIVSNLAVRGGFKTTLNKYKDGKLEKFSAVQNQANVTYLTKLDEESFVAIVGDNAYYAQSQAITIYGYKTYNNENTMLQHTASTAILGSNPFTSYNSLLGKTTILYKHDKDLNLIKTLQTTGEILNIIGRTINGNILAVMIDYAKFNTTTYTNTLNIVSIDKNLVITVLVSKNIANNLATEYTNFYTTPVMSSDKTKLYYLTREQNILYINYIPIDIDSGICGLSVRMETDIKPISPLASSAIYTHEKGLPFYNFSMNILNYGDKEYISITPVYNKVMINTLTTYLNVVPSTNTTSSQSYAINQANIQITNNWEKLSTLNLYEINNEANTLTLTDQKTNYTPQTDPVVAVFTTMDKILVVVRHNSFETFSINITDGKFVSNENINGPIKSLGIDELERIWYIKDTEDADIEMISPGLSANVNIKFTNNDVIYDGAPISNNINVDSLNYDGTRISLSIKLTLEGNATFDDNSLKSIMLTTKLDSSTVLPITITGDGIINIYTSIMG